jgi:hypothetical protein
LKFRELWKISSIVYKEISFQSIFSLRVGSPLPQRNKNDIKRLVANARTSTLISKLVTTVFIGIFAFTVFLPMTGFETSAASSASKYYTIIGSITAFLAVVLFLMVFMGLQVSTGFVSSKMADVLSVFPLTKQEISRILFVCFVRMFDIPLIGAAMVFLSAYFLVGGSLLGGLFLVLAIIITEIFALTLTIGSARFFYSRVAGGGGRSRWQSLVRLLFMIVWILPTFGAYLVVSFAGNIVQILTSLTKSLASILHLIVLIYPFSFGYLASYLTFSNVQDYTALGFSIAASFAYVFIAIFCYRWVTRTVRTIGGGGLIQRGKDIVKDTEIKPQVPWLGIIRKDLRVASRIPSFASLFLLPAMQTIILSISYSSISNLTPLVILSALIGISMITLLLPPTLLSMEGLASAFTRSLPMKKRTLISAKTLLSLVTYLISLVVLFFVAEYLHRTPQEITDTLTYGSIHAFAVCAGIMLELTLLTRKFWKEGFAVGNIYSRITTYVLNLIPGFVIVALPIVTAFAANSFAANLVLPIFFVVAASEFLVMTAIVAVQK